jgi:hypothetical protein
MGLVERSEDVLNVVEVVDVVSVGLISVGLIVV